MIIRWILVALVLFGVPLKAFAWAELGHVTVCEIAYRELTDVAREELKRIMLKHPDNTSFNKACLWADNKPKTRPQEHYLNLSRETATISVAQCGPGGKCIFSAIESDYAILADDSKPLKARAEALILLGHWIGDIHQPLHISYSDDKGGNSIVTTGACGKSNMHSVWDKCLVEKGVIARLGVTARWRTTRAYRAADVLVGKISESERQKWIEASPAEWANESYQMARDPAALYCVKRSGSCWLSQETRSAGERGDEITIELDAAYVERWGKAVEIRLQKAGVRLAHYINQALDPDYQ
jgi:hypothetical protein